jgi:hypothetical protein
MNDVDIEARRERAMEYEFRVLNHELVLATQLLLGAVAGGHQNTRIDFDASLDNLGCDAAEREAIEMLFLRHGLIEFAGAEVRATDKGRRYAESGDRQVRVVELDRKPSGRQALFPFRPLPTTY